MSFSYKYLRNLPNEK
ncbi:hypothetical protein N499_1058A, partial [Wolbachia pipientis wVitA]